MEITGFQSCLACNAVCIIPWAVCILAGEVFFLEVTVGFKTENVTVGFTGVIGAEQFGIIVPLCYFSLGVTDVEVGIYVEVAEGMAPVQVQLPSTCT